MFRAVADSEVAAYKQLIEYLARRYSHVPEGDYDDLVQEGMISVWEALRRGHRPSYEVIRWNMFAWLRNQRRLRRGDAIAGLYLSLTPEWQEEFGIVLTGLYPRADREVRGTHPPEELQSTARAVDGHRPGDGDVRASAA